MHCIPFVCSALAHALLSYMCPMGPWAGHGVVGTRKMSLSAPWDSEMHGKKRHYCAFAYAKLVS